MRAPRASHEDYPTADFWHDIENVPAEQIRGGLGQKSDYIVSKSVFPAFEEGQHFEGEAHIALLMSRITERMSLLDAINTGITIKGLGNIDSLPVSKNRNLLTQGSDFAAGQVGLGGIVGVASEIIRRRQGVSQQETKLFNLRSEDKILRGQLKMTLKILHNARQLRKSIIAVDRQISFDELSTEQLSAVVLIEMAVKFSSTEVNGVLTDSTNVGPDYKSPRLVIRLNFPNDQLDGIGNRPGAFMASAYRHAGDKSPRDTFYNPINIPPTRYDKTPLAEPKFKDFIAKALGISPLSIANYWPYTPLTPEPLPAPTTTQEIIDQNTGVVGLGKAQIATNGFELSVVEIDGLKFTVLHERKA